jgi:histidyl-tRNA synthetase
MKGPTYALDMTSTSPGRLRVRAHCITWCAAQVRANTRSSHRTCAQVWFIVHTNATCHTRMHTFTAHRIHSYVVEAVLMLLLHMHPPHQMANASAHNSTVVVLIGPDEVRDGVASVRAKQSSHTHGLESDHAEGDVNTSNEGMTSGQSNAGFQRRVKYTADASEIIRDVAGAISGVRPAVPAGTSSHP